MPITPNWTGPWSNATLYNAGDLASYQGSTWIATTTNTGQTPGQSAPWSLFAAAGINGINAWRGTWSSVTVYNAFDAVEYNNGSYISLVPINQGNIPASSPTQWAILAEAGGDGPAGNFTFLGVWSSLASYVKDDIVSYLGSSYVADGSPTVGLNPATDTANWALIASVGAPGVPGPPGNPGTQGVGFTWQGGWSATASYHVNDVVGLLGTSYVAVMANTGVNPSTDLGANWQVMASPGLPPNGVTWTAGSGPPVAPALVGSLYSNRSGSAGSPPTSTLYVYTQIGWVGVV